jgi:hypothetical protein
MELNEENKTYSKLAAGAAVVFFPYTIYQSYKNKKISNKIFHEAEVNLNIFQSIIVDCSLFKEDSNLI